MWCNGCRQFAWFLFIIFFFFTFLFSCVEWQHDNFNQILKALKSTLGWRVVKLYHKLLDKFNVSGDSNTLSSHAKHKSSPYSWCNFVRAWSVFIPVYVDTTLESLNYKETLFRFNDQRISHVLNSSKMICHASFFR